MIIMSLLLLSFIVFMAVLRDEQKKRNRTEYRPPAPSRPVSKPKPPIYTTPGGEVYNLFLHALEQPHLLVAGATGSGKSVLINGLIATALYRLPNSKANGARFILIDPKRVALAKFRNMPHTLLYADTHESIIKAMKQAEAIMDARNAEMQRKGLEDFDGGDLYVFIDELMDLMTTKTTKKEFEPVLQRICQLGRSSKVHIIAATQCPLREIIPTPIKCNIDARFALRTENDQDSRNIIRRSGAELLPNPRIAGYAKAFYKCGPDISEETIPMISKDEMDFLLSWWNAQVKHGGLQHV